MPNHLKAIREMTGISQAELARQINISRQALSAIETNKQDPSLPVALRISESLKIPLQHIFFIEGENMITKTGAMTEVERLSLVNQYQILQALHKDDKYEAEHYRNLKEIFQKGYEYLYPEAFDKLWKPQPIEVSEEVLRILDLHRAMLWSLGEKPEPADIEKVKFRGFDANNEGEHLGFARFYLASGERFEELKAINSHTPTLRRYRRMLAEWKHFGSEPRLSHAQIDSILEAGIRPALD